MAAAVGVDWVAGLDGAGAGWSATAADAVVDAAADAAADVDADAVTGVLWSAEDEFAATILDDFERSASPAELREWRELVVGGVWPRFPTVEDAWSRTARVPPRPLPGVTGVVGAGLAAGLSGVDPGRLSPAQLVEAMAGAERLVRWAQGVQLAAVAAFVGYAEVQDPDTREHPLPEVPGGRGTVEVGFGTQREIEEFCSDGIGAALGVSYTAARQIINAALMAAEVPLVASLLAVGRLDAGRVRVLARELAVVPGTPEDVAWLHQVIVDEHVLTPRKLQRTLRRRVMERFPDGFDEAHRRECRERRVWVTPQDAGMAVFCQYLSADEAATAFQAVNAEAWALHDAAIRSGAEPACQRRSGAFKPLDGYRADAFMASMAELHARHLDRPAASPTGSQAEGPFVGKGGSVVWLRDDEPGSEAAPTAVPDSDAAAPTAVPDSAAAAATGVPDSAAAAGVGRPGRRLGPARVMLHVYMAASTVAGLDNAPADLLGYGPISADHARDLVEDARLIRILTDPFTGDIQAVDTPSYRVPRLMRWAMQARDRSCVFPTCDVPASDVQADHTVPHPFGRRVAKSLALGSTTLDNLRSLCTHHHRLKTHGGWTIQSTRGARLEWISPTGHSYLRNADWGPPSPFWPDHPPTDQTPHQEPCPF